MSYTAEITERSLPRDRQALLTNVLVRELNVEPEEAELTALVMPAVVGPFESAADRDAFLVALAEAGFAARPGAPLAEAASAPPYAPPATSPAAYTPPAAVPPAYVPPPPSEAYVSAAAPSSNGTIIGVAILLGVIAAVLAVVVLTQDRDGATTDATVVEATPGGYQPTDGVAEPVDVGDAEAPTRTDDADFALGFSPRRGVNWDVFTASTVTRYASAPNATPIPVRDRPSARHGTATGEIPPGGEVTTSGCLPRRPEDGGRWCEVEGEGDAGWVYDRYLTASAQRSAPPPSSSGGVQVVSLRDGQTSLRLSEGGRTWNLPRPLSPGTSVSSVQRTSLAGRDIVQFEARDARWTTTYFWEYRQGLLHFAGDDGRGTTNISEAPGSRAVIAAALGYVPDDDVVRGSGNASRAPTPQAPPRRSAGGLMANVPNIIVLGSYQPYDQAGLDARYAQAQRTGLTLQVVSSDTYGMTPGLTVIVAGPYDRDTALRLLDQARVYVPDAFRKALD